MQQFSQTVIETTMRAAPAFYWDRWAERELRAALADETARAHARMHMRFLLGGSSDEAVGQEAARYVVRMVLRRKLRWLPGQITQQDVQGAQRLEEARATSPAGVVLAFMHHGQYDGAFASLRRVLGPVHVVFDPDHATPIAPRWARQHLRVVSRGGPLVAASVGVQGLADELRQGHTLAMATDVPGRTEIMFAGRRVRGASGPARIAHMTGSPLVPLTARLDATGVPALSLQEPIWPNGNESAEDLLGRLHRVQEQAVLQWPSGADMPYHRWVKLDQVDRDMNVKLPNAFGV